MFSEFRECMRPDMLFHYGKKKRPHHAALFIVKLQLWEKMVKFNVTDILTTRFGTWIWLLVHSTIRP